MLNASADIIELKGNRVSIESDNFTLTKDGTITAKKGIFDNCEIKDTCKIYGTLHSKHISACENGTAKGAIDFTTDYSELIGYSMSLKDDFDEDGYGQIGAEFNLGAFNGVFGCGLSAWGKELGSYINLRDFEIYAESKQIVFDTSAYELGYGWLRGEWRYNDSEIATKADIQELATKIANLGG
jgi:hypothetical protein